MSSSSTVRTSAKPSRKTPGKQNPSKPPSTNRPFEKTNTPKQTNLPTGTENPQGETPNEAKRTTLEIPDLNPDPDTEKPKTQPSPRPKPSPVNTEPPKPPELHQSAGTEIPPESKKPKTKSKSSGFALKQNPIVPMTTYVCVVLLMSEILM